MNEQQIHNLLDVIDEDRRVIARQAETIKNLRETQSFMERLLNTIKGVKRLWGR